MLQTLHVRNIGAVDDVVIDFAEGLNVLSGETGAGKTLLVEALHLVLGGGDRNLPVRDPDSASSVEAVFIDEGGAEVLFARELPAGGRLRALIDGRTVSAQILAERAATLCELHGQHEHQVLRQPGAARALLDRAGRIDSSAVQGLRLEHRRLVESQARLGGSADDRSRRIDFLAHELGEIDAVAPADGDEIERLLAEVAALSETVEAKEAIMRAGAAIDGEGDEPSAVGMVQLALSEVPQGLTGVRDDLLEISERLRTLASRLRDDLEALEEDPHRLGLLDERVGRLQGLVRKHGHSLSDVISKRDEIAAALETLREDESAAVSIGRRLDAVAGDLAAAEGRLLQARRAAAAALSGAVHQRLGGLALEHARFEAAVDGPGGDQVAFLFAGSRAFEPAPLAEAASGGELSRVMLALTLATDVGAGCLVFDEVDAGIGGATARSLAACLAETAMHRQVIVVTHLATVAAAATHHVLVSRGASHTSPASVRTVRGEERVAEVARMLSGGAGDDTAMAHAASLLDPGPTSRSD
jgi:DNA repair protein RecN (Recombination protein N)